MEVVKGSGCFNHPYIDMVNTLKNNGYEQLPNSGGRWIHKESGAVFLDALLAYLDYMERRDLPSSQELRSNILENMG